MLATDHKNIHVFHINSIQVIFQIRRLNLRLKYSRLKFKTV